MQAASNSPGQIKFIRPSVFPAPPSISAIAKQRTSTTRTLVCAGTHVTFQVTFQVPVQVEVQVELQVKVQVHQEPQEKVEVKSAGLQQFVT